MKRPLIVALLVLACVASASQTPRPPHQTPAEAKLWDIEAKMQLMIANHSKLMDQLHHIEAMLDNLTKSLHQMHENIKGK